MSPAPPSPRSTARTRREARVGYTLVAPAIAFVGVFILYPLGFGAFISFTNYPWSGRTTTSEAPTTRRSCTTRRSFTRSCFTLEYTAIVTVPILVVGYLLAVFTRSNRFGSTLFRTCFFLPFIVGHQHIELPHRS